MRDPSWKLSAINPVLGIAFSKLQHVYKILCLLIYAATTKIINSYNKYIQHKYMKVVLYKTRMLFNHLRERLKGYRVLRIVSKYFKSIALAILVLLIMGYCSIVLFVQRYKVQQTGISGKLFGHVSTADPYLRIIAVLGLLSLLLILNWDNHYPRKELLAVQGPMELDSYNPVPENLSNLYIPPGAEEMGVTSAPEVEHDSIDAVEVAPENIEIEVQDAEIDALESLLVSIKDVVGSGLVAIDQRVNSEVEFLSYLNRSPHMLLSILDRYEQFPDGKTKEHLRALLATSGNLEIESHAIQQLTSEQVTNRKDWSALLRNTGIHTTEGRNIMLDQLQNFSDTETISDTLLAIIPQVTGAGEKQKIIDQLSSYVNHHDENVRSAAVVSVTRWADSNQSYILEQAITDTSEKVRQAAVSAAFTSSIKSEAIKTMLLDIMQDDNENWSLRVDAHNALSAYSLLDQEHAEFFRFHQKHTEHININEVRG